MRIVTFAVALLLGLITFDGFAQVRVSAGCERSNAQGPRSNVAGLGNDWFWYAGEKLTWSVTPPTANGTPTLITLEVDNVLVDSTSFPGTVSYVFPEDGQFLVLVNVNSGWATFDATCIAALPPSQAISIPTLTWQGIAVLVTLVAGFAYYRRRKVVVG